MQQFFQTALNWSELWALFIPLASWLYTRDRSAYLRPVRFFLLAALLTNGLILLIAEKKRDLGFTPEDLLWNNNFLYNIESVFRLLFFAWFFLQLRQRFMHRVKWLIPLGFLIFVVVNFSTYEPFIPRGNHQIFSSRLLATEAALMLFYCFQFYIYLILEDKITTIGKQPGFWVVTGLSIYMAANFFIFLFYEYLSDVKRNFAINIWDVHNVCFILLCCSIAFQFLAEQKKTRK